MFCVLYVTLHSRSLRKPEKESYIFRTIAGTFVTMLVVLIVLHKSTDSQVFATYLPPAFSASAWGNTYYPEFKLKQLGRRKSVTLDGLVVLRGDDAV